MGTRKEIEHHYIGLYNPSPPPLTCKQQSGGESWRIWNHFLKNSPVQSCTEIWDVSWSFELLPFCLRSAISGCLAFTVMLNDAAFVGGKRGSRELFCKRWERYWHPKLTDLDLSNFGPEGLGGEMRRSEGLWEVAEWRFCIQLLPLCHLSQLVISLSTNFLICKTGIKTSHHIDFFK